MNLERWSKFGHFGQGEGELQYPGYVATDLKGNIFVSDMNSNKVQVRTNPFKKEPSH